MRKIIRLTERDLTKLVKRVLNEGRNDFNDVLEMVDSIEENFDSFFKNVLSKRTDDFEKHPDFPLEHMVRFVLSVIKDNPNLAKTIYQADDYLFYGSILTRPSDTIIYWKNLYCRMNYEMGTKDPEICKHPEDIDWEIVKQQSNDKGYTNNNNKNKNKNNLNEPQFNQKQVYTSFDEAYSFMKVLDEYLTGLVPSYNVCDKKHLNMLHRIYNTAHYKVDELKKKYKSGVDLPAQRNFPSNSNDEKINDFIKKYDDLSDTKFYEFAELLSKEIGVSVEEIGNKRREFIKKYSKSLKPKHDEGRMRKDPHHKQAQEMFSMAGTWLDCCKKGYYDCDDDDPPFKFNDGPFKYKEPNVTYEPIGTGGGQPTKDDKSGNINPGREMSEQIRRTLRKLL